MHTAQRHRSPCTWLNCAANFANHLLRLTSPSDLAHTRHWRQSVCAIKSTTAAARTFSSASPPCSIIGKRHVEHSAGEALGLWQAGSIATVHATAQLQATQPSLGGSSLPADDADPAAAPTHSPQLTLPACPLTSSVMCCAAGTTRRSTSSAVATRCPPGHRSAASLPQLKSPTCGSGSWPAAEPPGSAAASQDSSPLLQVPACAAGPLPLPSLPLPLPLALPDSLASSCARSRGCSTTSCPSLVRATSTSRHGTPCCSAASNASCVLTGAPPLLSPP